MIHRSTLKPRLCSLSPFIPLLISTSHAYAILLVHIGFYKHTLSDSLTAALTMFRTVTSGTTPSNTSRTSILSLKLFAIPSTPRTINTTPITTTLGEVGTLANKRCKILYGTFSLFALLMDTSPLDNDLMATTCTVVRPILAFFLTNM